MSYILYIFSLFMASIKPISLICYWIFVLFGIYLVFKNKENPFKIKDIRLLNWLFLSYFSTILLSVILSPIPGGNDIGKVDRDLPFLFAPFAVYSIYKIKYDYNKIILFFKLGTIMTSLILIGEILYKGHIGRYSGMYSANMYGDIVAIMTFLSISQFYKENIKELILSIISLLSGIFSIIISESRGSLLGLFIILLFFILLLIIKNKKYIKYVIILSILLSTSSYLILSKTNKMIERFNIINKQIVDWKNGKDLTSSIGMRLEMYKSGIEAFKNRPIFGYGFQSSPKAAAKYASKDKKVQWKLHNEYNHLHNEILTNMVSGGLISLSMLLAMTLIPFFIFIKNIKNDSISITGATFILSYMILGTTHAIFGIEYLNELYIIMLTVLLLVIRKKNTY